MINYVIGIGAVAFLVWMVVRHIKRNQLLRAQKEILGSCSHDCTSCSSGFCH